MKTSSTTIKLSNEKAESYLIDKFRAGSKLAESDKQFVEDTYGVKPADTEKYIAWLHKNRPAEYGIDGKEDKHQKAEIYLRNNYRLFYNCVTGKPEITDNQNRPVITEVIWHDMNKEKVTFTHQNLQILLRALMVEYDPFKDFFKNLPEWDGVDYITKVANCVKTDNQEFWQSMFRKALVRSIACAIGNKVNRMAIILISRQQNTGKTMFIRYLNPWGDSKYYCEEKMISGKKDSEMLLAENFIFNLDEMQGMDAKQMNTIKATISKSVINQRKAYRADNELYRRRCTFWGSSNLEEYLTDDTGNTRWLGFKLLGAIDWNTYNEIPVHYLWTQAYHLYRNGFDGELTPEEAKIRDTRNSSMEQNSNEIDICSMLFEDSEDGFMSNAEILKHYNTYFKDQATTNKISRALTKLGFKPFNGTVHGKSIRGFRVRCIPLEMPQQQNDIGF